MHTKTTTLTVALAVAALLTGCTGQTPDAPPATGTPAAVEAPATYPNPVRLLGKATGCRQEPGASVGQTDAAGNRYADCNYYNNGGGLGTAITLRVGPAETLDQMRPEPVDDEAVIEGDQWHAVVYWPDMYDTPVDVVEVAGQLGGRVVEPGDMPITPAPTGADVDGMAAESLRLMFKGEAAADVMCSTIAGDLGEQYVAGPESRAALAEARVMCAEAGQ